VTPRTCIFRGLWAAVNHHSVAASFHVEFSAALASDPSDATDERDMKG